MGSSSVTKRAKKFKVVGFKFHSGCEFYRGSVFKAQELTLILLKPRCNIKHHPASKRRHWRLTLIHFFFLWPDSLWFKTDFFFLFSFFCFRLDFMLDLVWTDTLDQTGLFEIMGWKFTGRWCKLSSGGLKSSGSGAAALLTEDVFVQVTLRIGRNAYYICMAVIWSPKKSSLHSFHSISLHEHFWLLLPNRNSPSTTGTVHEPRLAALVI